MYLVQSENSHKVRILVTKRLFVQSEFVQSEGRTKRGIAVLTFRKDFQPMLNSILVSSVRAALRKCSKT